MKIILDSEQIKETIDELAQRIAQSVGSDTDIAVIGIRSRGEILAQRLCRILDQKFSRRIPIGTLDITLYRDDLDSPSAPPQVRSTEIAFDITDKIIILVDDVLYTGRSIRAALDAIVDFGRPKAIRLAVLVERAGREYPIGADFIGLKADVKPEQSVQVNFVESDAKDQVTVE
jgi:pyrimidine operon attenuation protein/uracil phosphoribosyltransferase